MLTGNAARLKYNPQPAPSNFSRTNDQKRVGRNDRVPIVHHSRPALDLEQEANMNARGPATFGGLEEVADRIRQGPLVPVSVITPAGGDRQTVRLQEGLRARVTRAAAYPFRGKYA